LTFSGLYDNVSQKTEMWEPKIQRNEHVFCKWQGISKSILSFSRTWVRSYCKRFSQLINENTAKHH
jgi:hypothetical protein